MAGPAEYGLQGSITAVPADYSLSFVIAESSAGGVNAAFEEWGDKLLHRYGKSREMTYRDFSLNYLGYSTDNGAYYYYQTEDHTPGKRISQGGDAGKWSGPGKDYQQTLIDVKDYADQEAIPYKYVLLDSWWYYQGVGGGVTNWIGRPGISSRTATTYLRNKTGWPIMGHNRFWAVDNVYCTQNGGDYDFVVEKKGDEARQATTPGRWSSASGTTLLYNSSKWGLFMYEQDWLDTEYDNVMYLNKNASAARTWLAADGHRRRPQRPDDPVLHEPLPPHHAVGGDPSGYQRARFRRLPRRWRSVEAARHYRHLCLGSRDRPDQGQLLVD